MLEHLQVMRHYVCNLLPNGLETNNDKGYKHIYICTYMLMEKGVINCLDSEKAGGEEI